MVLTRHGAYTPLLTLMILGSPNITIQRKSSSFILAAHPTIFQHLPELTFWSWWHQAITWTDVSLTPGHEEHTSVEIHLTSIVKVQKNLSLKYMPSFPGHDELSLFCWNFYILGLWGTSHGYWYPGFIINNHAYWMCRINRSQCWEIIEMANIFLYFLN